MTQGPDPVGTGERHEEHVMDDMDAKEIRRGHSTPKETRSTPTSKVIETWHQPNMANPDEDP